MPCLDNIYYKVGGPSSVAIIVAELKSGILQRAGCAFKNGVNASVQLASVAKRAINAKPMLATADFDHARNQSVAISTCAPLKRLNLND